jgi:hypothetical protein
MSERPKSRTVRNALKDMAETVDSKKKTIRTLENAMKKQEYARQVREETGMGAFNHRSVSPLRVESKIKAEAENDRNAHESKVRNKRLLNEYGEWKYEEDVVNSEPTNDHVPQKKSAPGNKVNYAISYDKNLQPETIKEKTKGRKGQPVVEETKTGMTSPSNYANSSMFFINISSI